MTKIDTQMPYYARRVPRIAVAGLIGGLALTLTVFAQEQPATRPTTSTQPDAGNAMVGETVTTPEGVTYVVTAKPVEARVAQDGDVVMVHYTGMLEDGTVFDTSRQIRQDAPYPFHVPIMLELGGRQVIQGWEIGLRGMAIGEKRRLTIPSQLAYGEGGRGPIPPNATLIFDVELVGLARADAGGE